MSHTAHRIYGVVDILYMRELMKNEHIYKIKVEDLKPAMFNELWTHYDTGMPFSPMELVDIKVVRDDKHWKRIFDADMSYPIYVIDQWTNASQIEKYKQDVTTWPFDYKSRMDPIDGAHRIMKAFLIGHEEVTAQIVPWEIWEKSRIDIKNVMLSFHSDPLKDRQFVHSKLNTTDGTIHDIYLSTTEEVNNKSIQATRIDSKNVVLKSFNGSVWV